MTVIPLNVRSESDQKAIVEQLDRILKSGPFQQSRRRQRFLQYIVNETLAGRGERLKGYNIALSVFDRPKTFDPAIDPIVRIEAARLREKLREYYETEGQGDPIDIELRKGTYAPHIAFRQPADDENQAPAEGPAALKDEMPLPARRGMRRQIALPVLALVLVLGAAGAWLAHDRSRPAPKEAAETPSPACPEARPSPFSRSSI